MSVQGVQSRLMAAAIFASLLSAGAARVDKNRRYLLSVNSNQGIQQHSQSVPAISCGPYQCIHASGCSYSNNNGVTTHSCTCIQGWTGEECNTEIHQHSQSVPPISCGPYQCFHATQCSYSNNDGVTTHSCTCIQGWTGEECNTAILNHVVPTQDHSVSTSIHSTTSTHPTSSAVKTTLSSATMPTTSHLSTEASTSAKFYTCNKIATLTAVAKGESIASSRVQAGSCPNSGAHSANELVYQLCQVPQIWHQGSNVLELCKQDAMPEYSPLAVFENGAISDAGIFVACLQDGFQMIQQTCDQPPRILRMTVDNSRTPSFFTVL